jgi:hypothetical protein
MNKVETFEQFLSATSPEIGLFGFMLNLVITAFLAHILSIVYVRYGNTISNRHNFARNFVLLAVTIMIVITIVKSSLALSLGLVGALSIVRYRTAIKEPEELAYTFLTIAIGLGMGADQIEVTTTAFFLLVAIIIIRKRFDSQQIEYVNIRISGEKTTGTNLEEIINLAKKNSSGVELKRVDEDENTFTILLAGVFADYTDILELRRALLESDPAISFTYMDNIGGI